MARYVKKGKEAQVEAARIAGRASAEKLTPEQRKARSEGNGFTTLVRYGSDYYRALGKLSSEKRKQAKTTLA